MNNFEAKREARQERFEELAAKAEREAAAVSKAGWDALHQIPFGQPILIGHHSERGDRAYRARACGKIERAAELSDKAAYYREKAAAAASNTAIFSEDPEAVVKLREKIAAAEKKQEFMKKVNAVIRKFKHTLKDPNHPDRQNFYLAMEALSVTSGAAARLMEPDFCGRYGFPDYALQNNNANIRRMKGRLAELEATRAAVGPEAEPVETESPAGFRVVENPDAYRIQLFFPGKPPAEVRAVLKANGFRWAPSEGAWQRHLNDAGRWAVRRVETQLVKQYQNATS
jgi:hypothetical protein